MQHEIPPRVDPLLAKLTHRVMEKIQRGMGVEEQGWRMEGVGVGSWKVTGDCC